jgi:hypothetical protein
MTSYRNDPRWINLRYRAVCAKCRAELKPGERAFYYPKGRDIFCDGPVGCGRDAAADFTAAAEDEDFYNAQYR